MLFKYIHHWQGEIAYFESEPLQTDNLSMKTAFVQIPLDHCHFKCSTGRGKKKPLGWIWIDHYQKFAISIVNGGYRPICHVSKTILNLNSNVETCIGWSKKIFFEQFAPEKLSSTMLWTNHQPYSCKQIYPQLKVISNHLSEVHCLLRPCLMVIKQNICKENKFQLQSISKAYFLAFAMNLYPSDEANGKSHWLPQFDSLHWKESDFLHWMEEHDATCRVEHHSAHTCAPFGPNEILIFCPRMHCNAASRAHFYQLQAIIAGHISKIYRQTGDILSVSRMGTAAKRPFDTMKVKEDLKHFPADVWNCYNKDVMIYCFFKRC